MSPAPILTARLNLVAITPAALRSEQAADNTLADILNCHVPPSWPHANWEPHVFELLLSTYAQHPEDIDWHRYILLRQTEVGRDPSATKPTLIGSCGAFRWPANRSEAEFGYAILPEFRLQGYATEAAQAMLAWIEAQKVVSTVIAHTFPELLGSIRILERCDFTLEGPGGGPGAEPGTLRFVKKQTT